jgi:hypothetical protein
VTDRPSRRRAAGAAKPAVVGQPQPVKDGRKISERELKRLQRVEKRAAEATERVTFAEQHLTATRGQQQQAIGAYNFVFEELCDEYELNMQTDRIDTETGEIAAVTPSADADGVELPGDKTGDPPADVAGKGKSPKRRRSAA